MALKGHTRIELTNVETGEVEVHEDDNMVTNALSKLLGNYGCFCGNPLYGVLGGAGENVLKRLTGGLMLFDNAIEENPEIIYAPNGVSVVGCGAQTSYSGANTMAGSYNSTESGWTDEGGYKHVWDFATHQANGNIACASLTTAAGGKITDGTYPYSDDYKYGVGTNIDNEIIPDICDRSLGFLFNNFSSVAHCMKYILFADATNNYIIAPSSNAEVYERSGQSASDEEFKKSIFYKKSIDLSFYRIGFTNFSIFDSYENGVVGTKYIKTITVEMPDGLKEIITDEMLNDSSYYWCADSLCDNNNIYLIIRFGKNIYNEAKIKVGETFYIWEIETETFGSNYYSFTNQLSENILASKMDNTYLEDVNNLHRYMCINNEYIVCQGESGKTYIINKNNTSNVDVATNQLGDDIYIMDAISFFVYGNKVYIIRNTTSGLPVLDVENKKIKYKNVSYGNFPFVTSKYLRQIPVKDAHYILTEDSDYLKIVTDPAMLVTINNLETPIQKTSAQTMKVTYVLTQE